MPNNLTDNPAVFPTPIQVPAAGDPRSDTSVATPFQQLANRTANLAAQVAAVVPYSAAGYTPALPSGVTSGVSGMLTAATIAALQSIPAANRTDQMVCAVSSVNGTTFSPALYQYSASSTATPVTNVVIEPTDTNGRWFLQNYGALGVPNGIPQFDAGSRLTAAVSHYGTFYETFVAIQSVTVGASATWVTIAGTGGTTAGVSVPGILVNDIIQVDFIGLATVPSSTSGIAIQSSITLPGGSIVLLGNQCEAVYNGAAVNFVTRGSYVATVAGTYTPLVQMVAVVSSGSVIFATCEMRIRVVRP
jgi:hypothetical protein